MNDEARMTNDEGNPNDETRKKAKCSFRHLSSSLIRHSSLGFRHFQDAFDFAAPRHGRRPKLAEARVAVSSFHMRDFEDESSSRSLAGSLLVAHPNMLDPNFRRTVLFISEHDPNEGALGVIINRPLDRQVADLVTDTPPAGLADAPLLLGGPVGNNQLMFAAFEWKKGDGVKLSHNVALEQSSAASGKKNLVTIFPFVGYPRRGAG